MLGKLIILIITVVIFVFYVGFNLDNRSDIWLFFKTYKNVPVFMNTLLSFSLGVLCSLPLVFAGRLKRRRRFEEKEQRREQKQERKEAQKAKKIKKPEIMICDSKISTSTSSKNDNN